MKKLVFITFLCIAQIAISQNYKFGKVSEEELLEKTNPDYPEANATVLYKKQQISFEYIQGKGFIQKNEIQERIKIYNKEGFDYASLEYFLNMRNKIIKNENIINKSIKLLKVYYSIYMFGL